MEPHTQISSLYTWITTLFSNTRIIYLLRDPNHCAKRKKRKKRKKKKKKKKKKNRKKKEKKKKKKKKEKN